MLVITGNPFAMQHELPIAAGNSTSVVHHASSQTSGVTGGATTTAVDLTATLQMLLDQKGGHLINEGI